MLRKVKAKIDELPKKLESEQAAELTTTHPQHYNAQNTIVIPAINILSTLPGSIQALERLLLRYIIDASVPPELRAKFRYIAQILIALYPQAVIQEAARHETARSTPHLARQRALPTVFPKATPIAAVGKLSETVLAKRARNRSPSSAPKLTD